ncbi:MAG: CRISPR-associated endonuclease Cas2 [Thermoguttaceae bacterium]|nr:CRISPR-associated endonuclease Cas2 [Thermoguttaceae bacterium]MDW8080075.1 CRISPR-associated endonuclease Cas2 [Thermoguttaceae bacterium]
MTQSSWVLVCYDVRDQRRLRHTVKKLEGYGQRIQYSISRCRLAPSELQQLRWELEKIMAPEGHLLIVR